MKDGMKPLKINHKGLEKEIGAGNTYIEVGNRKFLLMEVNEVYDNNSYQVTDLEEEKLLKALKEENPILSDDEIQALLGIKNESIVEKICS